MKKCIYLAVMILVSLSVQADDFITHGGIRYKIESFIDQELRVTYPEESDNTTTDLVIPATIKTKQGQVWTVTAIGDGAFTIYSWNSGYKKLRSVTIPKTVKIIHKDAFKDSNIEEITADCPIAIPIEPIEKKLRIINLGASATQKTCEGIGSNVSLNQLEKITLNVNNRNLSIADGVLYDKLKTILLCYPTKKVGAYVMPNTVKSMVKYAFFGREGLTSITFSSQITEIERMAFYNSKNLQSVVLPKGLTEIGESAFSGCSITRIDLPNGLKRIGDHAFSGCAFETVNIPGTVSYVGGYAFCNNHNLKKATLPDGITAIGDITFMDCTNLEEVNIPNTVTSINWRAFCKCASLKKIVIPEKVNKIGAEAFVACDMLTEVY